MLERELIFEYPNITLDELYMKTLENNVELIKVIPEITRYMQGKWADGIRRDEIIYKLTDIPENLNSTIQMFLDNNGEIRLGIKIEKRTDINGTIKLKIKVKVFNILSKIIMKIVKTRIYIDMAKIGDNITNVIVKYQINSLLSKSINDILYKYIETKLNDYFIKKIDNYIKNINS